MFNDPLYIKTQNELRKWRENKKSPGEHIPLSIKDNIRKLNLQYTKSKLRSSLDLSGCSLSFLNSNKPQAEKLLDTAHFIELPTRPINVEKEKAPSRIEIDLPMNISLRIYL